MNCPICRTNQARLLCDCSQVPPRLNTLAGLIHRCTNCGFIFKETVDQSLHDLEDIYQYTVEETSTYFGPTMQGYRDDSPEIQLYRQVVKQADARTGHLTGERRLLDVGCGTGALLDLSRKQGFTPHGIELNPHFAQYANDAFGIPVIAGDLSVDHYGAEYFDVITMMDLIEHVPDPVQTLETASALLKPGGLLIVYTPNHRSLIAQLSIMAYNLTGGRVSTPAYTVFGTNHVCFFDHGTLPAILERTHFQVDEVQRIAYDPEHQGEVNGKSALASAIKLVEVAGQAINLPYRLLAFARKLV